MIHRLTWALACLACLAACTQKGPSDEAQRAAHTQDSLMQVINQKESELNDIMGTFNDIQEGFRDINLAQGRVSTSATGTEKAARKDIMEDISFIKRTLTLNRERISRLQQQLKSSSLNSEKLKAAIGELNRQMEEKQAQIEQLQAQLEEKNVVIEEQGRQISHLNTHVDDLTAANEAKAQVMDRQDKELNTAWYVFGTKSELREQGIVRSSEVLKSNDFNKDYFTKIDIRVVKSIKLYSKNAQLLTTHPAGSYTLERDAQKQYTLYISDPARFWSVSKYLVILVR